MTSLGAAQKGVLATPVQNAASKKVAAAGWEITPCLNFSGRGKGTKSGFKPTPQSWAEQRGTGRLQFLAYISQICLLVVRMLLVLNKILLNLHYIYRTVLFSFDLFSNVLSGGRSQNTSPHHWRTLSLRFYHFNYTESISLMISVIETWRAKSGGFSAFLLRF